MEVFGLEARQSDLARGIVIVKCARALTSAEQRELWECLAGGGITEDDRDEPRIDDEEPLRLLSAPWMPPSPDEVSGQRAALERAHLLYSLDAVWFVKVETGVDGEAWQELRASHLVERQRGDETSPARTVVDAVFDEAEVLYTAPDAPTTNLTAWPLVKEGAAEGDESAAHAPAPRGEAPGGRSGDAAAAAGEPAGISRAAPAEDDGDDDGDDEGADEDDEGADEDDEGDDEHTDRAELEDLEADDAVVALFLSESHWRNGSPPMERTVPFPVEHYPEVLEQYDWREFGIALKLGGAPLSGEDSVVNAFFALWLSAYQDERIESFEPFARADVAHDRAHRSALLWVERFTVPATPNDQVSFLLWIVHRLHEIVPVAWARFDIHDESAKVRRDDDGEIELILAGNPLDERMRRYGESEALAWAVAQSGWSRSELAAMLVEISQGYDPDLFDHAETMERLLRRALSFDASSDAALVLTALLVRTGRTHEAVPLARDGKPTLRLFLAREVAEHAEARFAQAQALLDEATLASCDDEDLSDLAHAIAEHAPRHLASYLRCLPSRPSLLPHLYNASFDLRREQSLVILRRVLELPEPDGTVEGARAAMVMAWNNACIHAHAIGEYEEAAALADRGLRYGDENPHIYHSAACAYAAIGAPERALAAVREAIAHDYVHIEKMETDPDLSPLQRLPEFTALFAEWRHQRADLN